MNMDTNWLIENLTRDLQPVRPVSVRTGLWQIALAIVVNVALVAYVTGVSADVLAGSLSAEFVMSNGLLLMLGLATTTTVIMMISPQIGNQHDGWKWAAAMVCLLPLAAGMAMLGDWQHARDHFGLIDAICTAAGLVGGLLTGAVLVHWLRKGAPARPERAMMLVGMASAAVGMFAYGLHCPINSPVHIGVWHSLPILIGAVVGRFGLGKMARW